MKRLLLLMCLTACGSAESGDGASADPTPGGWVGFAPSNAEMSCRAYYYQGAPETAAQDTACTCVRQEAQKRWTYADFSANSSSYFAALKADGTAKGCGVP